MSRKQKTFICIIAGVIGVGIILRLTSVYRSHTQPFVLTGAVIREDSDPRKQSPLINVQVSVLDGTPDEKTQSDTSGFFRLVVHPPVLTRQPKVTLSFEHPGYHPREVIAGSKDQLYVVRMEPLDKPSASEKDITGASPVKARISNVRLRYSMKNQTMLNVGSVVKQFEVQNTGGVPCNGQRPCSPDGKWKAATSTLSLDAPKGNEFRNVRASCIAGPCPFTRLAPSDLSKPAPKIEITALTWSDTASFLVEAEVTRTMTTDVVRHSYPFIIGQTMSFALPAASEGPSITADLNGEEIVFPLGPKLTLSWTNCNLEVAQGGNKLYRCDVKPGYQLQQ